MKRALNNANTPLPNLPAEIWINILSFLPYKDLKNCLRVCQSMEEILKTSKFDGKLFREPPNQNSPLNSRDIILHPVFDKITYECDLRIKFVGHLSTQDIHPLFRPFRRNFTPLQLMSACEEFATQPAQTIIQMQIYDWPIFTARDDDGITVFHIMEKLCKFFGKTFYFGLTFHNALGDRNKWTGWDEMTISEDGVLLLRATSFGSISEIMSQDSS